MRHDKLSSNYNISLQKSKQNKYPQNKLVNIFLDPFGKKRRSKEFEFKYNELDQRAKELEKLEAQLIKERKIHDKRIAEFVTWKEKLFSLESEIEKRKKDLVEHEDLLKGENCLLELNDNDISNVILDKEDSLLSEDSVIQDNYHDILDKIPQCAAIIQRSIVKQVNSPFVDLIGFKTDEIVDKSLFDFIASEGLGEIEKYYLNRLKGNDKSKYKTIFSTKDDGKIRVEVNIKPTLYNGEKAEIAIVTELEGLQPDIKDSSSGENNHLIVESQNSGEEEIIQNLESKKEEFTESDDNIKDGNLNDDTHSENKKSQDEINAMIKKMKDNSDKTNENNIEPESSNTEIEDSSENLDTKIENSEENNTKNKDDQLTKENADESKKSQDEINDMIKKMKDNPEKTNEEINETDQKQNN